MLTRSLSIFIGLLPYVVGIVENVMFFLAVYAVVLRFLLKPYVPNFRRISGLRLRPPVPPMPERPLT